MCYIYPIVPRAAAFLQSSRYGLLMRIMSELVVLLVLLPQVFRSRIPQDAIALTGRLLEYTPTNRVAPLEACSFPFFDELREPTTRLPNGREMPFLFNFSPEGKYFITVQLHLLFKRFCVLEESPLEMRLPICILS